MIKLFFILYFFLSYSVALSDNSASLNLRYEPIQPLTQPHGLNIEKVKLGKKLFNDPRLSHNNNLSCASCHNLQTNGADTHPLAIGRNNITLNTNTLTVFNSSLNHQQFWDGRAHTLEQQIDFVLHSEKEFYSDWNQVIDKLNQDKTLRQQFKKVYNDGITANSIRNAIATFERTLITSNSRFDQYLLGDTDAINAQEKKGYRLFKSYGCVACHQGKNIGGNMFMKLGLFGNYYSQKNNQYLGRYNVTKNANDLFVFRVPSLRLVTLTPPYFHDGSIKTLTEAIQIMAKYQLGRSIKEQHINDIIAFLKTLPGDYLGESLYEKAHKKNKRKQ